MIENLRIINVLEIINGVPSQIQSFPIYEEQLSGEVIKEAEEFFIKCCSKPDKQFTEEEIEFMLDEGCYDDANGYELYLIWSNDK